MEKQMRIYGSTKRLKTLSDSIELLLASRKVPLAIIEKDLATISCGAVYYGVQWF